MPDLDDDRSRPIASRTASNVTATDIHSVTPGDGLVGELDALAGNLRGLFVVTVEIGTEGHTRRHLYRSAGAAEKCVLRARLRGASAHVTLCQLLPVGVVAGLGVGQ